MTTPKAGSPMRMLRLWTLQETLLLLREPV